MLQEKFQRPPRGEPYFLHKINNLSNANGFMDSGLGQFVTSEGGAFEVLGKSLNLAQQGYATFDYLKTGENKALTQQVQLAQANAQQAESIAAIEALKAQKEADTKKQESEKQTQMLMFGAFALIVIVGAVVYLKSKST